MSYCTARRQAAQSRVRSLEERLREVERLAAETHARERLRAEIEQAITELVTIGDCGD